MSTEHSAQRVSKNAGVVSLGIIISRLFGLVRDIFIGSFFADNLRDIFFWILTIPNFSRRFLGEGALSSVFIPTFTQEYKQKDKKKAWDTASSAINISFIVLVVLTLIGIATAPLIVKVGAAGFSESSKVLATFHLRIIFSFLIFICLQAIFMGMLNVMGHFFIPSFAAVFFNLALIGMILIFMMSMRFL